MNRLVALALALSVASSSAFALAAPHKEAPTDQRQANRTERPERGDKKFPMKADEFKKHVAERVGKAREFMEKRISKKNVGADKAKEIREKFNAGVARINKKVDEVSADGSVTKDEAKEVRDLFKDLGNHGKRHGKKKLATLRGHAPAPPPRLPPL
jgi:hypothetical protein